MHLSLRTGDAANELSLWVFACLGQHPGKALRGGTRCKEIVQAFLRNNCTRFQFRRPTGLGLGAILLFGVRARDLQDTLGTGCRGGGAMPNN